MPDLFDPGFLPEVPLVREEKTFASKSGQSFTLAMEVQAGGDSWYAIQSKKADLEQHWSNPARLVKFAVSDPMCDAIAALMHYSVQPADADPLSWIAWGFEHWATLLQRDIGCFMDVIIWVRDLESRSREPASGNG